MSASDDVRPDDGRSGEAEGVTSASEVLVDRAKLLHALAVLKKIGLKQRAQALFWFGDGELWIEMEGASVSVPASGQWKGQGRVAGHYLCHLALPKSGGPVRIRREEKGLAIEDYVLSCAWQVPVAYPIELPIGAELLATLRAIHGRTEEEIERSGLRLVARGARERQAKLIRKAAGVLKPLGIDTQDIRELVERQLSCEEKG